MTIWKYPFAVKDRIVLQMPEGAKPLCVQMQGDSPFIWAAVDPEAPDAQHVFALRGTGHDCDVPLDRYVGTFQMLSGALVFHLFDLGENAFTEAE